MRRQRKTKDDRINNLLHKFPFSLPYGGNVRRATGGWNSRGTGGGFWSEGASSAANARGLNFNGVYVWSEGDDYKTYGFPIRCVAKGKQKTTASTTFFTSSPSRYRMEGTSVALPAVGSIAGRSAASGQRVPVQLPPLAPCSSTVSASGRRTTPIRRTASQFVAKPKGTKDDRINNLLHKFPFSLPYGGFIVRTAGGWVNRGTSGLFWSEGAYSATNARLLSFDGVDVWPENNTYKANGFPVRCVTKIM